MCYLRWNDWFAQNLRKREVKATAFQAEVDQSGFAHQNHTNVITIQRDRLKTFRSESWVIIQHFGHEEVPRSLVRRPRPDGDLEQGRRRAGPRGDSSWPTPIGIPVSWNLYPDQARLYLVVIMTGIAGKCSPGACRIRCRPFPALRHWRKL